MHRLHPNVGAYHAFLFHLDRHNTVNGGYGEWLRASDSSTSGLQ